MALVNIPVPLPSVLWLPDTVGFAVVLQHTPRAVTVAPPSELILPPPDAVAVLIDVTTEVEMVGKTALEPVAPFSSLISF
jgi:hypothetical protein